ncbi:hypothetical protein RFM26_31210 [Mesorhizobium sp. VK23B]|uniref:Uncharacterized protein n=1 Tax=Mesorhizobium dulcispinae TaxID=3072316 RepID=A0ABU4XRA5_9HYPH|nr:MULTISPECIES: hypothetical protein [unclassified Mesorhizobium]MDX8470151.1 hypothetical protein [Mesorhizobium sp. VK23B]MDX8476573.1 hypothetical protein [Mesorhizobium sp. VK23A]
MAFILKKDQGRVVAPVTPSGILNSDQAMKGRMTMDAAPQVAWGRSPYEDDGTVLEAMLFAEERGSYSVLKSFMSDCGSKLRNSSDPVVQAAYCELEGWAEKAFEHEAKHGRQSLMKWDHPTNVEWVRIGLIKLSEDDRRAFEAANGFV